MNTYRLQVRARCPQDHGIDVYHVTLESESMLLCEDIIKFFAPFGPNGERNVYQEDFTKRAATALGCRVTTVGYHSGIKVTCVSPA